MDDKGPVCGICGQPATTHISIVTGSELVIRHFCGACGDTHRSTAGRTSRRRGRGVVLILVGVFVLFISLFADQLAFGQSEGFGWRQLSGVGIACLLFLIGALLSIPALVVSGLAIGILALLADWLQFGASEGFGLYQTSGTVVGLVMVLIGLVVAGTKKRHRAH